ncbi:hypothetical protein EYZ11_011967 [Aspergillus tanneri]|uniref:Uncharacterized protein n=1 Tax=Aspergillus tanneri TaxID=1220188 RepID=A0A4S3J3K4_9EURO|nr:hypothetical protein EYZ11_011967 [Aspergillus tanneri]
MTVCKKTSH